MSSLHRLPRSSHNFLVLFSRLASVDPDAVWREAGGVAGEVLKDSVDAKLVVRLVTFHDLCESCLGTG